MWVILSAKPICSTAAALSPPPTMVIAPLSADYHLVIPSLPGYGFSGKPSEAKWNVEHIAAAWDALMRALGYPR